MPVDEKLAEEISVAAEEAIRVEDGVPEPKQETDGGEESEGRKGEEFEEIELEEIELRAEEKQADQAEASKPEAEATTEEPATPAVSDDMLTRAIQSGLTLAEAKAFPNEQALLAACMVMERGQQVQEEEPEEQVDPLSEINFDEYEPEVAKVLKTLVDQHKAQHEEIQQLKATQEYAAQGVQQAAAREVEGWFDGQIENLGPDFQKSLGVGKYSSLAPGSPQHAKREQLAETMAVMLAGYQQLGRPMPPRETVFQQAAGLVLRDEFARIEQDKLKADLRKMSGKHIQRAGVQGKKTTTDDPLEEIAALVDEKYFSSG